MGESALQFSDDQLDELTQTLLEDADATNSGSITFEELRTALSRHPGLVENLTFRLVKLPLPLSIHITQSYMNVTVLQTGFNLAQSHAGEGELSASHTG